MIVKDLVDRLWINLNKTEIYYNRRVREAGIMASCSRQFTIIRFLINL